jgi:hypothetical protein
MPRTNRLRRFEPRYGVSREKLAVENTWLCRELEDHSTASMKEIEAKRSLCFANAERTWQHLHLQVLVQSLSDRERTLLQALLFRDLYHVLELYRHHLQPDRIDPPANSHVKEVVPDIPAERFGEFLFEL